MKKSTLTIALLLAAVVMTLAACTQPLTGLDLFAQKYSEIASAKSIEQHITITSGSLTQYESAKTFAKTDAGYSVTGSTRSMNTADADKAFTVVEVNETVTSIAGGVPTLKLNEAYFEAGFRLTETSLAAVVKQANVKDVFALEDSAIAAPTADLQLELTLSGEHLTSATISYTSQGSNVVITLSIAY